MVVIAEAKRLGLLNICVEHKAGSPHLSAELNGNPISLSLSRLPPDSDRHPRRAIIYLHRQLRRLASRGRTMRHPEVVETADIAIAIARDAIKDVAAKA